MIGNGYEIGLPQIFGGTSPDMGTHMQAVQRFGGLHRYPVAVDGCDAGVSRDGHQPIEKARPRARLFLS